MKKQQEQQQVQAKQQRLAHQQLDQPVQQLASISKHLRAITTIASTVVFLANIAVTIWTAIIQAVGANAVPEVGKYFGWLSLAVAILI